MASNCKNPYNPWWVPGGTHNDIDFNHKRSYFLRIAKFLKFVKDFNFSKASDEREEFYKVEPWWQNSNHIYFKKITKIEENYRKFLAENGKKMLKDQSYLSGSSATSQRSLQAQMIEKEDDNMDEKTVEFSQREEQEELERIDEVGNTIALEDSYIIFSI